uniref:Uncharacterized protein n=1 Tax=Amphiprion percula TaxID=161767 RepID=A0A3P8TGZ3_AMPPE
MPNYSWHAKHVCCRITLINNIHSQDYFSSSEIQNSLSGYQLRAASHLHSLKSCTGCRVPTEPNVSFTRAELTFGRPCWRPARRPPASSSGRSCLPAAPLSGCCRFSECSPGSQT